MKKINNYKSFIWWIVVWFLIVTAWVWATVTWWWELWSLFIKVPIWHSPVLPNDDVVWSYKLQWDHIQDGTIDSWEIEDWTLEMEDLDSSLQSVFDQVWVNSWSIINLETSVLSNQSSISSNSSSILNLETDVSSNQSTINLNSTGISNLETRVWSNEADISWNDIDISNINSKVWNVNLWTKWEIYISGEDLIFENIASSKQIIFSGSWDILANQYTLN